MTSTPLTSAPPAPSTTAPPAYRDRPYLLYTAGQSISVIGDQVWYVSLAWAAVQLSSPAVAGLVMTVSAVPRLVLLLLGGVYVDRFGPKRLMIGSDLLRVAVCLVVAAIALTTTSITLLIVVGLVFGVVSAVFMPAAGAMGPLLLRDEQQATGVALRELTARLALTLGAPLGGAMVAIGGLSLAALVNALTFALSALTLWTLRPRRSTTDERSGGTTVVALRQGVVYLWRNRLLLTIVVVALLGNLGLTGPLNVGMALLAQARGWGAQGVGLMLAGFGGGAAVSAVVMLRWRPRRRAGTVLVAATLVQGLGVVGMVVAGSLWQAVTATAVAGLMSGVMGILMGSLSQVNTDDAYRGRISSIGAVMSFGVTPLALAVTGVAVEVAGLTATFLGSSCLLFAAGLLCAARRELRSARLP